MLDVHPFDSDGARFRLQLECPFRWYCIEGGRSATQGASGRLTRADLRWIVYVHEIYKQHDPKWKTKYVSPLNGLIEGGYSSLDPEFTLLSDLWQLVYMDVIIPLLRL